MQVSSISSISFSFYENLPTTALYRHRILSRRLAESGG